MEKRKVKQMIQAAVFDMDGLMFDTERVGRDAWNEVGRELGFGGLTAVNERCLGRNKAACRAIFEETFHGALTLDTVLEAAKPLLRRYYDINGMPCKKGLRELLHFLKQTGRGVAMATSSDRPDAEWNLEKAGLREYFDVLVCGDMVEKSKPDPEIYLTAARLLGAEPGACIGLEDSRNGILSVKNAGMHALLIPDLIPPDQEMLDAAEAVFDDLGEVVPWLERMGTCTAR